MSLVLTNDEFYNRCVKKYKGKFLYHNDYNGIKNKIKITCSLHGDFNNTADRHLYGKDGGCLKCQKIKHLERYKTYSENFIKKCISIHENKYDYSKVNYVNNSTNVIIICPYHGEFEQIPTCHLNRKQGCPECNKKTMGGYGGYNIKNAEKFKNEWENKKGYLYLVKMKNLNEEFIKVGITVQKNIRRRFAGLCLKYEIKVISLHYDNLYNLIYRERNIIDEFKSNKYTPKIKFKGHYECFKFSKYEDLKIYFDGIK